MFMSDTLIVELFIVVFESVVTIPTEALTLLLFTLETFNVLLGSEMLLSIVNVLTFKDDMLLLLEL